MPWNQIIREIINTLKEKIEKKKFNRRISRISQELEEYLRFKAKKKDRQINMAKPTNLTKTLIITAKIKNIKARILIDFRCLGNFVFFNFVKKAQLYTQVKEYQYTLYKIDDQPVAENSGTVIKETILISVDIQGH
jgi:hypothetical protein